MHYFPPASTLVDRFRGFYPVVVDVETGGFDSQRDALLEIAAVTLEMRADGRLVRANTFSTHVVPFPGSNIDPRSLEITGIDPTHPLRMALDEREALDFIFDPIRRAQKSADCQRAILVGHNAAFDLNFINAAIRRTGHKRSPFHPFSTFDTVSLSGLAFGQTVLAKSTMAAGLGWDTKSAHSAVYDAEVTADLFCSIVNRWRDLHVPAMERLPRDQIDPVAAA
jgi:ribonuclease T